MSEARILAINVVHDLIVDPVGDVGRTAIDKRPVTGPAEIQTLGVVGDTCLDRKYHGGRDAAVYAYAREDQATGLAAVAVTPDAVLLHRLRR